MDTLIKMLESAGVSLIVLLLFWMYLRFFDENVKSVFNTLSQKEIENHKKDIQGKIENLKSDLQLKTQQNIERLKADLQKENVDYQEILKAELQQRSKEIELILTRRSKFEEKILLDRYIILRDLETRIGRVMTDLNRLRHGTSVEGLMRNGDIVPLTEVFELLAVNKYLITERFHKILWDQSQILIRIANVKDAMRVATLQAEYVRLLESFYQAMDDVFGIDKITWETR